MSRSDTLTQVLDLDLGFIEDVKSLADLLVKEGLDGEQLLKLAGAHGLEEHARHLARSHVLRPGELSHAHLLAVGGLLLELLDTLGHLGEDEVAHPQLVIGIGLSLGLGLGLSLSLSLHRLEEVGELHDLGRRLRAERDLAIGDDLAARHGHWRGDGRDLEPLGRTPLGPRHAQAAPLVEGRADQADGGLLVDLLAVVHEGTRGEEDTARPLLTRVDEGTARTLLLVRAVAAVLARLRRVEALLVQLGLCGPREGRRGPGDGTAGHLCFECSGRGLDYWWAAGFNFYRKKEVFFVFMFFVFFVFFVFLCLCVS